MWFSSLETGAFCQVVSANRMFRTLFCYLSDTKKHFFKIFSNSEAFASDIIRRFLRNVTSILHGQWCYQQAFQHIYYYACSTQDTFKFSQKFYINFHDDNTTLIVSLIVSFIYINCLFISDFKKDRFYRTLLIEPMKPEYASNELVQEIMRNSDRFFLRSVMKGQIEHTG